MLTLCRNNRGQSATEVAVLGSLVILAFSYLISLTAKINAQQLHTMTTFRLARDTAFNRGSTHSTSGNLKYVRLPNITSPYEPGELVLFSSSGSVIWRNGVGPDSTSVDISQTESDKYSEAVNYKVVFTRTETPGSYPETHRKVDFAGFPGLDRTREDQP